MKRVTLYAILWENFSSSISYDSEKSTQSRRCVVEGYVWNTESKFNYKRCSVSFSHGNSDYLYEFAEKHGVWDACGSIRISAEIDSEKFEYEGNEAIILPIEISISVDSLAYSNVERILQSSIKDCKTASLTLEFSDQNFEEFPRLEQLDLSAKSIYPIVSFEVKHGWRGNTIIRVPDHKYDSAKSSGLTFTAIDAKIQCSVWHSEFYVYKIRLVGEIIWQGFGLNSTEAMLVIEEYPDIMNCPEEAFPGSVFVSRDDEVTYCSPSLYATRETLKNLAALLSEMSKGDKVEFSISIITDGLPLEIGDRKYFDVVNYTPTLIKKYV
jgi:hypothetical protein